MELIKFSVGDRLIMKKKHPCGGDAFTVMRTGTDVRMICTTCARDLTLPRIKLEKSIKMVVYKSDDRNV